MDERDRAHGGGSDADEPEAMDEPPPFPGRPRRGGKLDALKEGANDAAFINRFPDAFRIGADDNFGRQPSVVRSAQSSRDAASFDSMFPGAAAIKRL
jgi:hypothetical protein